VSNKSGTSEQVISLPTGGGALSGIGETFAPDLHTGTGNFTVPIALPPGRNGFQPELNLVYSTGNGNGPFGLGWSLSIPGVSRKTAKGVPRYQDATDELKDRDTFILSGAEDLVPLTDRTADGIIQYRPRTEGLFTRIEHHQNASNDYWKVRSKDGLTSFYGTEGQRGDDPAVVANPDNRRNVCSWMLSTTEDFFGNHILYDYVRDSDVENLRHPDLPEPTEAETEVHHWDQIYLKQIRYVDYDENGATDYLVSVTFLYEERPDPFSSYRCGFEIRTRFRCTGVEIHTNTDERRLVRCYDLVYLDQRDGLADLGEQLPINGVSLLNRIKVTSHDGEVTAALPPLEFGYTRFRPATQKFFAVEGREQPTRSLASADLELANLFGNGLPDILEMNGTVRYWRNLGHGRFDIPRPMKEAPAGFSLADPEVQLMDADGDGCIDLLVRQNGLAGYFPLQFNGEWDRRSFQVQKIAPSFSFADAEVQMVDLNGDGVTDVLRSGSRLEHFFNDPKEGWKDTRHRVRRELSKFPNVNFSDPRVRLGDMSGDDLQDIVLIHDGNVEYWPNLGHGNWGPRVAMRNNPRFPYGYDPRRLLLGDVDGDGLADLVYVDYGKVTLWINQSGNRWSDPIEIAGTPPVTDVDAVRLIDLLGNGTPGVLWSSDATVPGRANAFFLDFAGGVKPYLLNKMNNHMGAETQVEYKPSTHFYLIDAQKPKTRWQTSLPFPMQVVACVEVIDHLSRGKLTTEYRYHHGCWDGAERELRGFGMVEQLDTEAFERYNAAGLAGDSVIFEEVAERRFSPPTLTKTWFHQGPIGEEFGDWAEADYSQEYWDGDPSVLGGLCPELLAILGAPDNRTQRRIKRDAVRALRGSVLRTELYALDGEQDGRPYTVTESQFDVRKVDLQAAEIKDRPRIFFPQAVAQRTTQWERGDDPMTQFSFTEEYDDFGQPQKQTQIACPRGWRELSDTLAGPYLATRSRAVYAAPVDPEVYIMDRVAKVTTHELRNDGSQRVLDLKDVTDDSPALNLIGQTLNFYDGEAFVGRPFGEVGAFGALVRSESLVLTEAILHEAYKSGPAVEVPSELPPYMVPGTAPVADNEYPQEFLDLLPPLAGYTFHDGDAEYERGYFVSTARHKYDFHDSPDGNGRGMLLVTRDPLGGESEERDTAIEYDTFELLPTKVTDPTGLTTEASYDMCLLQPHEVTDPNGNRTEYTFTPLGLLQEIFVRGRDPNEGDSSRPSTRFVYDFLAFENSPPDQRQPIFVHTVQHEHHDTETDVPLPQRDETIETREFSDGFGRLLQTRTQAEDVLFGDPESDAPLFGNDVLPADQNDTAGTQAAVLGREHDPNKSSVVVSGWQIYDNKGQVVEKFEPFFSQGFDYLSPQDEQDLSQRNVLGQKVTMFYDPRGQVIRTTNPDDSEQRVIYGVPGTIASPDLSDPDVFEPTPWEAYTYDANDNAGRTHPNDPRLSPIRHHLNTPAHIVIDALGRTVLAVERNRDAPENPGDLLPAIEEIRTESTYDIRGNLLTVTDALDREAFRYAYDLADNPLRIENIDAGLRRIVLDAAGNEVERRDSKGALILPGYDVLQRPIRLWARDDGQSNVTLRERLIYGDSADADLSETEALAANLRGQLYQHYDEAGRLTLERYDLKGNVLEKVRQVIRDEKIVEVFPSSGEPSPDWQIQAFRVDWQQAAGATLEGHAASLLDPFDYRTSAAYDALNRIKVMQHPQDVDGQRKELRPQYNRAGALEQVTLDSEVYVERIAYNARGQRTLIALGNGIVTRYAYDPQTFRLARLRSEAFSQPVSTTYQPTGKLLQDFAYEYDLVGNILAIHDRVPGSGVAPQPDEMDRVFGYDAIYRLTAATGRECKDLNRPQPWNENPPWCGFNGGNHGTPNPHNAPDLTRRYRETYSYDKVGNLTRLRHHTQQNGNQGGFTRKFDMIPGTNRLHMLSVGNGISPPPSTYMHDDNGNIVKENTERHFEWDHSDRMKVFRNQVEDSEPSMHAHYLYDASGQRVKKLVRKQGGSFETTVYIDDLFEHHRWDNAPNEQNNHLHVMDDQQRIAMVRAGEPHPDDKGPAVQYHLGDHLGSSNFVMDDDGSFINREEYTPYGETSFGSFGRKRYQFTGKERDEENGLYYHGARYYAPWLGKWVSCDPAYFSKDLLHTHVIPFGSPYLALLSSPINYIDVDGREPTPPSGPKRPKPNKWDRLRGNKRGALQRALGILLGGGEPQEQPPRIDPTPIVEEQPRRRRTGDVEDRPRSRPGSESEPDKRKPRTGKRHQRKQERSKRYGPKIMKQFPHLAKRALRWAGPVGIGLGVYFFAKAAIAGDWKGAMSALPLVGEVIAVVDIAREAWGWVTGRTTSLLEGVSRAINDIRDPAATPNEEFEPEADTNWLLKIINEALNSEPFLMISCSMANPCTDVTEQGKRLTVEEFTERPDFFTDPLLEPTPEHPLRENAAPMLNIHRF
jgi:RHS repeat-associated protein